MDCKASLNITRKKIWNTIPYLFLTKLFIYSFAYSLATKAATLALLYTN